MGFRVGIGYDVHRFGDNLPLFLGGVRIDYHRGLIGHSDADVLLHAICDALLGAAAKGDIGRHFPDTSDEFKGIDSKILLKRTADLLKKDGYHVVNLDAILVLQQPKVKNYIREMQQTIAAILGLEDGSVSVKATTTEKLGFEGREEGVSAQAVVLIER
jgi:2-C-methyl-D-erythritol 2,4-cyclodiphosphate synthase